MTEARTAAAAAPSGSAPRPFLRALVVVLLLLLLVSALQSWRSLSVARQHEADLRTRIAATQQRIVGLEERVRRMRDDPATLERLAREELGWVREGDIVVVLPVEPEAAAGEQPERAERRN